MCVVYHPLVAKLCYQYSGRERIEVSGAHRVEGGF